MNQQAEDHGWKDRVVEPRAVLKHIRPGMNIFLGSGVAEPRTLMKLLAATGVGAARDLEFIQLNIHGDIFSLRKLDQKNYRLNTFFSGWFAGETFNSSNLNFIPGRYSQIPKLIKSGRIPIDAAFIQVTPPTPDGHCSLGLAVDIAREAMEQASLVVAEINRDIPFTFGDTVVSVDDFDMMVESTEAPFYADRWPVDQRYDRLAANVARVIEDGDCICFNAGPLFEALGPHLVHKKHLGIHAAYVTDALMDLVKSGAVSNYRKSVFRGKTVASYVLGSRELMAWIDRNPLVELQSVEQVFDPVVTGRNANMVVIDQAREVDLFGRVTFPFEAGHMDSGPGMTTDMVIGAEISPGGRSIFALPSRDAKGDPNIRVNLTDLRNQFGIRESIDLIITEYGIASLKWRPIRERALALIDIAHPDDRKGLIDAAKQMKILSDDQVYLFESAHLYPAEIATAHTFRNDLKVRFRAIKPSDEEAMRRLFYRFSDETIFRRFFYPMKTMPHKKMQEYVNVNYSRVMSVVALVGEPEQSEIIAEARYEIDEQENQGEIAFIVDDKYQGLGVATYLYNMLVRLGMERGVKGFCAEVLQTNTGMMKVFEKGDFPVEARLEGGVYRLNIPFYETEQPIE